MAPFVSKPACTDLISKNYNSNNDIVSRLMALTAAYASYDLIQFNGQRIFSIKPEMYLPKPPKGTEVFVGKLPRDMYEDELLPLMFSVGRVYKLRLMVDFSGKNRGYAFVTYFGVYEATKAIQLLNNYEVRPSRRIGVYKSVDNCRLFMGNIPKDKTKEELWDAVTPYVDGLRDIIMYRAHDHGSANRGFVFLEFEDHRSAAMARRNLTPGSLTLWDHSVLVDWADPLPEVDPYIMSKVTKLYIRNIDMSICTAQLYSIILSEAPHLKIMKLYKNLDYAFVHFATREEAETALQILNGKIINGYEIEVTWARPKSYSKANRAAVIPENFCTSVPPRMRKIVYMKAHSKQITAPEPHGTHVQQVPGALPAIMPSPQVPTAIPMAMNQYHLSIMQ